MSMTTLSNTQLRKAIIAIVKEWKLTEKYGINPDLPTDEILALIKLQQEALLDCVEKEVIGEDIVRWWDDEYHMCTTCDFQPTDDTTLCLCEVRNAQKAKQRIELNKLRLEL